MSMKEKVRRLLAEYDRAALVELCLEDRRVITALNRLIFDGDALTRWRAVEALGWVAAEDPYLLEKIIARLIYTMNDDSGSIGWTAPQALGEICAADPDLVEDFFPIVISSVDIEAFTAGVAWAVGRVSLVRPDLTIDTGPLLMGLLEHNDPEVRGLASLALGRIGFREAAGRLEGLKGDRHSFPYYSDGNLVERTVGQMAAEALERL